MVFNQNSSEAKRLGLRAVEDLEMIMVSDMLAGVEADPGSILFAQMA